MRKTRTKKRIYSIPELRRSFEYVEEYVDKCIKSRQPKEKIIKNLRKEWKKVFSKELDKKSAEAFVNDRLKHKTLTKRGGMAPLDYTTRPGIYLEQGNIPHKGHLEQSGGGFGSYVGYVDRGFFNPETAQQYDPLPQQTRFPTNTPLGMGSNLFKGGKGTGKGTRKGTGKGTVKREKRRTRKGVRGGSIGSLLSEAFNRPISASSPPSFPQDLQDMSKGRLVGPSPDQVQYQVKYSH